MLAKIFVRHQNMIRYDPMSMMVMFVQFFSIHGMGNDELSTRLENSVSLLEYLLGLRKMGKGVKNDHLGK